MTGIAIFFKSALWAIALFSLVLGLWLVKNSRKAIERQIAFYRLINWKMEPLDWAREERSTRVMGVITVVCGIVTVVLILR